MSAEVETSRICRVRKLRAEAAAQRLGCPGLEAGDGLADSPTRRLADARRAGGGPKCPKSPGPEPIGRPRGTALATHRIWTQPTGKTEKGTRATLWEKTLTALLGEPGPAASPKLRRALGSSPGQFSEMARFARTNQNSVDRNPKTETWQSQPLAMSPCTLQVRCKCQRMHS